MFQLLLPSNPAQPALPQLFSVPTSPPVSPLAPPTHLQVPVPTSTPDPPPCLTIWTFSKFLLKEMASSVPWHDLSPLCSQARHLSLLCSLPAADRASLKAQDGPAFHCGQISVIFIEIAKYIQCKHFRTQINCMWSLLTEIPIAIFQNLPKRISFR